MKFIFRTAIALVLVSMVVLFGFCADTVKSADVVQLNFAAAGVQGTYYPLAIGMSKIVSETYPEIRITVETTGGGVENARLVGLGINDLGLANNNYCLFALQGKEPYKEKHNFYSVAYLYPAALHIIVMDNSQIHSIADLKGKKIAAGPAGGGGIEFLRDMLPYYDMKESDLKISYLSFTDGANALRDGNVDVCLVMAGPPAGAALELAQTANIRFIGVEPDIVQKMYDDYGYYVPVVFPKDMFKTEEDVSAVGGGVQLIVRDGISEEIVYKITKAIFDNLDKVKTIHPITQYFKLETARLVSIPLHPGAEKYYKEVGINIE